MKKYRPISLTYCQIKSQESTKSLSISFCNLKCLDTDFIFYLFQCQDQDKIIFYPNFLRIEHSKLIYDTLCKVKYNLCVTDVFVKLLALLIKVTQLINCYSILFSHDPFLKNISSADKGPVILSVKNNLAYKLLFCLNESLYD